MRFIYQNMKHVPIPPASSADKSRLAKLSERAAELAAAGGGVALAKVEREIDDIVFRLFDLTPDEIAQVETALASTRSGSFDNDGGGEGE